MNSEELGVVIWKNCRNEWYRTFPYLDGAFSAVDYRADREVRPFGTDGTFFWFHPEQLLETFEACPEKVRRAYLHMLLHCLYLHILPEPGKKERQWSLACDMAVELMISREAAAFRSAGEQLQTVRTQCIAMIQAELAQQTAAAEQIYGLLEQEIFSYSQEEMQRAFAVDDHAPWLWKGGKNASGLRRKWERAAGMAGPGKLGASAGRGGEAGTGREAAGELEKSRYDYRKFLKQFAVLREEVELDTESFDYIYYSYGMEQYRNMPLIEPLEYKEGHKLEELVIAIDTSGSCSTQMVRQFLQESYSILGEKENFFRKMKVYLIQCDCVIQDAVCVHSQEEWEKYCRDLQIQGRAGTDFRPVFRYVEKLRESRELKNLKALIYFTDGDGVYPREAPDYETAFVFVKKTEGLKYVPKWARSLVVQ